MRLVYVPTAAKYLLSIDKRDSHRIINKIEQYVHSASPLHFASKLEGFDAYRYRVGHYRVVFEYEHDTVFILVIDKRKDVYRRL